MSISVTFSSTHQVLLASEFFLARRPVIDQQQNLVAHELLLCSTCPNANTGVPDEQPASASVISDVYQHGLQRVSGDLHSILFIDADALMSDIFSFLPPDRLVFVLAGTGNIEDAALARLETLAGAGFHFALVANRDSDAVKRLLPWVEGVRIDVSGKQRADLEPLCRSFKTAGKRLLAERVETLQAFKLCVELGFDFFQGYFFAAPGTNTTRRLSASQRAITELMTLIASDADSAEIEHRLKSDVALGLKLLRMANVPAFGGHRIDSLRQALMVLGRNELQRWLQLMLYADATVEGGANSPLLAMAATRARLIELLAQKLRPTNRGIADTGFTVGIMSLMDTLFVMPMEDILQQIPVVEEVELALLERGGYLGKLLSLAQYTEWQGESHAQLRLLLEDLKLSCDDLYALQLAAFEWSDEIARHSQPA